MNHAAPLQFLQSVTVRLQDLHLPRRDVKNLWLAELELGYHGEMRMF